MDILPPLARHAQSPLEGARAGLPHRSVSLAPLLLLFTDKGCAQARKLFADAKEKKAEGACLVRMAEMMRSKESKESSVPGSKEEEEAVVADKYLEEVRRYPFFAREQRKLR